MPVASWPPLCDSRTGDQAVSLGAAAHVWVALQGESSLRHIQQLSLTLATPSPLTQTPPPPSPNLDSHTAGFFFLCIISLLYLANISSGKLLHVHLDTRAATGPAGQQIWLLHHPPLQKKKKKVALSHEVVCEFMRLHLAHSESVARPSCPGREGYSGDDGFNKPEGKTSS